MSKIHTHYDNLMVSSNAPDEVIRASYYALSKKFHPDVNTSTEASRIMKVLNNSYEVLSDPKKRKEYDFKLQLVEEYLKVKKNKSSVENDSIKNNSKQAKPIQSDSSSKKIILQLTKRVIRRFLFILSLEPRLIVVIIFLGFWLFSLNDEDQIRHEPVNSVSIQEKHKDSNLYQKPETAPNGQDWPTVSGYLSGFPKLNNNGRSTILIKNIQNDSDFYVKLISNRNDKLNTVRHALIKNSEEFIFEDVSSGEYQLMYMDLNSGNLTKSEVFEVNEVEQGRQLQFSKINITLYKVRNGNFQSESIGLNEFMKGDQLSQSDFSITDSEI